MPFAGWTRSGRRAVARQVGALTATLLSGATPSCDAARDAVVPAMAEAEGAWVAESIIGSGPRTAAGELADLFRPFRLAALGDTLVIVDTGNDRLVLADLGLHVLATVGRSGSGPGEFEAPLAAVAWQRGLVVSEAGNARFTVLDRTGRYAGIRRSPGGVTSFAIASDGRLYAASGSRADYAVQIDVDSMRGFAPRPDTANDDASPLGAAEALIALTAGDTLHVFDEISGVLSKFDPAGRLRLSRRLMPGLLDSLEAARAELIGAFSKQGARVVSASLAKGLGVTTGGALLLLVNSARTTGLVIDPATYRARRIVVPDDRDIWTPLRSASSIVLVEPVLYALHQDSVVAYRIVRQPE